MPLLRSRDTETVTAAVAALRNLSIHNGNEVCPSAPAAREATLCDVVNNETLL